MKKKGHRDIPDFSRHPTRGKDDKPGKEGPLSDSAKKPAHVTPRQIAKPTATSSKSGRRGS